MSGGPFGHNKFDETTKQIPVMTAGAYTANDALGDMLTFQMGSKPDNGGVIMQLVLIDHAKQAKTFNLVLFNQPFTATADNAAFAPTDFYLDAFCIGHIAIEAQHWATFATNAIATVPIVFPFIGDTQGKDRKSTRLNSSHRQISHAVFCF